MRAIHLLSGLALAAGATAAYADEGDSHFKLALSFGSLGVGPEVTYRPVEHVGVRASATFFAIQRTDDIDGVTYRGKLKLSNYGAMVDVYPFGGGFRISGGARLSDNRVRLRSKANGPRTIGNTTYTAAQIGTLSGSITTDNIEPIVTIGYGGSVAKGLSLGFDAGIMFQGKPTISPLTATGVIAQADLDAERANVQHDIGKYKIYPVIQFSAGYRF